MKKQVEFGIEGMSCQHCSNFVAELLSKTDGISDHEVNLDNAKASVTYDPDKISPEQIIDLIHEKSVYKAKIINN